MKTPVALILTSALILSASAFISPVSAQSLNRTYIEGSGAFYPSYDIGSGSQDFAGWRIRGAVQIIPEAFVFGQYRFLTDDIDYTQAHFGAAYTVELARRTDLYVGPSIEFMDFDPGPDEIGFGVRGGIRHRINYELEIGVEVRYVNMGGDIDNDYVGATVTFQYHVASHIGLVGEVDVEDGEPGVLAGVRFNF